MNKENIPMLIMLNSSPYFQKHFLVIDNIFNPQASPQEMSPNHLRRSLQVLNDLNAPNMRFGYNSSISGASVPHFHIHGFYPDKPHPVETIPYEDPQVVDNVTISKSVHNTSFPFSALKLNSSNISDLARVASNFINFVENKTELGKPQEPLSSTACCLYGQKNEDGTFTLYLIPIKGLQKNIFTGFVLTSGLLIIARADNYQDYLDLKEDETKKTEWLTNNLNNVRVPRADFDDKVQGFCAKYA